MLHILSMLSLVTRNCSAALRTTCFALPSDRWLKVGVVSRTTISGATVLTSCPTFTIAGSLSLLKPEFSLLKELTISGLMSSCCDLLSTTTLSNIPVSLSAATKNHSPSVSAPSAPSSVFRVHRFSGCRSSPSLDSLCPFDMAAERVLFLSPRHESNLRTTPLGRTG